MLGFSIRTRVLLALNGTTLVLGLAAGWVSIHLVNRATERRAVHDPASNAARLIAALRLPLSDRLAQDIQRLTGCEATFVTASGRRIASTLPVAYSQLYPLSSKAADGALAPSGVPKRTRLGGRLYVAGACDIPDSQPPARVLLLLPAEVLAAEGRRAGWRIAWITLAAILITTGAGVWLAQGVTRPLRQLAAGAARMSASLPTARIAPTDSTPPDAAVPDSPLRLPETGAPSDVASLAQSFNQLLARLQSAQQELEHAARLAAIGQLASAVVHELRNPLCGIAMNARILADDAARRGERDPSLELIAREVERMDLYLQELLLLARPAMGSSASAPGEPAGGAATSVQGAVAAVAALLAGRCRHAGVEWCSRLPDPDLCVAIADVPLRQIVLNLALNALDAMPVGGRVTVAASAGSDGKARLTVSDTGRGVRPPAGQDVFAPFVSTKSGGSGLGLYVSRQIAERSGGQIGFSPDSPQGTTFWVELPLAGGSGNPAQAGGA